MIDPSEDAVTSITIELPDDVAQRASSLGLFTPEKIGACWSFWLGEKHGDAAATVAARHVEAAVEHVLQAGQHLTADLGGSAGTDAAAMAVIAALPGR
jgi:isocitrate/isopropylmalate dehydrogenase